MEKKIMSKTFIAVLIIAVFLSACGSSNGSAPTEGIPSTTPIPPTPTVTDLPPTPTITPSPTPIPGPWFNVPITLANVKQAKQLEAWGKGIPWTWNTSDYYYSSTYNAGDKHYPDLTKIGLGNLWTKIVNDVAAQGKTYVMQTTRGLYLYSIETGAMIAAIDQVSSYKISENGDFIATGHDDASVRVWNASDGMLVQEFQYSLGTSKKLQGKGHHLVPITGDVAFSHDNKMVAAGYADGMVMIWNLEDKSLQDSLDSNEQGLDEDHRGVRAIAFSPDNQNIMVRNVRNHLYYWQISDDQLKWVIGLSQNTFPNYPFSPDGKYFAMYGAGTFGYGGGDLVIINTSDGSPYKFFTLRNGQWGQTISFSPDWTEMYLNSPINKQREVRLLSGSLKQRTLMPEVSLPASLFDNGHMWGIVGSRKLDDQSLLAWGYANDIFYWWNFSDNKPITYPNESQKTYFSDDGEYAAFCFNGKVEIYTIEGPYQSITAQGFGTCDGIVFSPNSDTFAIWRMNRIALVNPSSGTVQNLIGHENQITQVTFSKDGALLASSEAFYPGRIFIWDTKQKTKLSQIISKEDFYWLKSIRADYYTLAFSPDNKILASRGFGNPVRLWNISDGVQIGTVDVSADRIAFSPDQTILATANRMGVISLWSIPNGEKLTELQGHVSIFQRITGINDTNVILLSFPPDGQDILSNQYERENVGIPNSTISSLSFLPDGSGILSTGLDGTIRLWGIDPNSQ